MTDSIYGAGLSEKGHFGQMRVHIIVPYKLSMARDMYPRGRTCPKIGLGITHHVVRNRGRLQCEKFYNRMEEAQCHKGSPMITASAAQTSRAND